MKTSTSLSEKERSELIDTFHEDLIIFAEKLQKEGVLNVECMILIDELYELSKIKKLNHQKIGSDIANIAKFLSNCFPQIKNQLLEYWNAWAEIFDKISPAPVNMRQTVDEYLEHMEEIDTMYKQVIKAVPISNDVALYAVFYMHILKREKIEYALSSDLEAFRTHIPTIDLESMFSVGEKMKKGKGFVTHGKAIRDALSHKKYQIIVKNGKKYIQFGNNEKGYDFIETWSVDEFLQFVQTTDFMYRTMFMLQKLIFFMTLLHESTDA